MDYWSNGSYDICTACGLSYGNQQREVMGMWRGVCAICGTDGALSNAWHDWGMEDTYVENLIYLTAERRKEEFA